MKPNPQLQSWLEQARVFFGEVSPAATRVYVELDCAAVGEGVTLAGTIIGPQSEYAKTLTTEVPVAEAAPGATRLLAALLPDACCWTPDVPFTYMLQLQARRDAEVVARIERRFGIRPLGVRGRDLVLQGKRVVLRTVDRAFAPHEPATAWREASAAMLVRNPSAELLDDCTRHGVLVCVDLSGEAARLGERLETLARYAAVGVAIVDPGGMTEEVLARRPRNLLLAARQTPEADFQRADWIQLDACRAATPEAIAQLAAQSQLPVLAIQSSDDADLRLLETRKRCDALQAALAGRDRCAGYLIELQS